MVLVFIQNGCFRRPLIIFSKANESLVPNPVVSTEAQLFLASTTERVALALLLALPLLLDRVALHHPKSQVWPGRFLRRVFPGLPFVSKVFE